MLGEFIQDDEMNITLAQFMLSPDIPENERRHFEKFYVIFSKIMALGNIKQHHILGFKLRTRKIIMLLEVGLNKRARIEQSLLLQDLQLSRSVDGFWTRFQHGVTHTESSHIERVMNAEKRKAGLTGKVTGLFRRGKSSEGGEE